MVASKLLHKCFLEKVYTARFWLSGCTFEAAIRVNRCKTYIVWWDSYSCLCTSLWKLFETKDNCSDQTPEQQWHFCNQRSLSDCSCFIRSNFFCLDVNSHFGKGYVMSQFMIVKQTTTRDKDITSSRQSYSTATRQNNWKPAEAKLYKNRTKDSTKKKWKGTKPINRRPLLSFFGWDR